MDSDQYADVKEVNGINLDNYFPQRSSLNTVIYVHKRFLKKAQTEDKKEKKVKSKREVKKNIVKEDKSVDCNLKGNTNKKDCVLQQTIKFAKDLVPIVIPPSESNDTSVFYTIKTCNKCKKKDNQDERYEKHDDTTFEKKRSKKIKETYKKEKKNHRESYSARYSITQSSQSNTLDDVNINQSLCGTLSDLSDKRDKYHKHAVHNKRKRRDFDKLEISESFEGLATERNDGGETKIKIQLMNEKEKNVLTESIRIPILDTVKECIKELNNIEIREAVKSVHRFVQSNSQKLDSILDKLGNIEKGLANTNAMTVKSSNFKAFKASKLEQLGEDLTENNDYSSEDEFPKLDTNRQKDEVITIMHPNKGFEDLGCGETGESKASTSVGVRAERQRQPARFCWTDTARKN